MNRPAKLEYVNCILCGRCIDEEIVWKDYKDSAIVRCRGCGLIYRNPRHSQPRQKQIFSQEWTKSIREFSLTDYRSSNLERIARHIQSLKCGGYLLDIGCSYGTFLKYFSNSNSWKLTGIEPSPLASRAAAEKIPHAKIINDTIENVSLPKEQYDVITIIDTFTIYHG
ncbi:MAG: class I SAM-dependent methyltransferase, partial [Anaerolineales bacterium]|nr:class I SAM-dependent methyltransferase [Anaerolineales bacterium]